MIERETIDPAFFGPKYTLCEVLRDLHRATDDPVLHRKIAMAYRMAKRMDDILRRFKADWDKGYWPANAAEAEKRETL